MRRLLAGLMMLAAVGGDSLAAESRKLDLATAERLALARDPRLQARKADIETARRKLASVVEWRNPELRGEYADYTSPADSLKPVDADDTWTKQSVGLRVFPPHIWSISALREAARAGIRSAERSLAQEEKLIVREVRTVYAEMLCFRETLSVVDPLLELEREQRATIHEQQDRKEATTADSVTADLDYLELSYERDNFRQLFQAQKDHLAALLGVADLEGWTLPQKVELPVVDVGRLREEDLLEQACAYRKERSLLIGEREALAAGRDVERSRRWPSLAHIEAGYSQEDGIQNDESWRVQAAVEIPVFSLVDRRQDRVLAAEMAGVEARVAVTRDQIAQEVREALDHLKTTDENWRCFRREAEPLMENMSKAMKEIQDTSGVDWATQRYLKEKNLRATQLWIKARHDYLMSILRLEAVVGMDIANMQCDASETPLQPEPLHDDGLYDTVPR
ncbi:MAG: TolC family protein [Lentisphaerota bacterium]